MLLELSCDCNHFMEFLNKAENAQIKVDFDMRGECTFSGFGLYASQLKNNIVNNNK